MVFVVVLHCIMLFVAQVYNSTTRISLVFMQNNIFLCVLHVIGDAGSSMYAVPYDCCCCLDCYYSRISRFFQVDITLLILIFFMSFCVYFRFLLFNNLI